MIGARVSDCVEEARAAVNVPPTFLMEAFRIGTEIKISAPLLVIEIGGVQRPGDVSFATVAELELRTRAAIRTIDEKHRPPRASVRHGRSSGLVDQISVAKAFEGERSVDWVRLVVGDGVRKQPRCTWGRLEPSSAPTAVDIE